MRSCPPTPSLPASLGGPGGSCSAALGTYRCHRPIPSALLLTYQPGRACAEQRTAEQRCSAPARLQPVAMAERERERESRLRSHWLHGLRWREVATVTDAASVHCHECCWHLRRSFLPQAVAAAAAMQWHRLRLHCKTAGHCCRPPPHPQVVHSRRASLACCLQPSPTRVALPPTCLVTSTGHSTRCKAIISCVRGACTCNRKWRRLSGWHQPAAACRPPVCRRTPAAICCRSVRPHELPRIDAAAWPSWRPRREPVVRAYGLRIAQEARRAARCAVAVSTQAHCCCQRARRMCTCTYT